MFTNKTSQSNFTSVKKDIHKFDQMDISDSCIADK